MYVYFVDEELPAWRIKWKTNNNTFSLENSIYNLDMSEPMWQEVDVFTSYVENYTEAFEAVERHFKMLKEEVKTND